MTSLVEAGEGLMHMPEPSKDKSSIPFTSHSYESTGSRTLKICQQPNFAVQGDTSQEETNGGDILNQVLDSADLDSDEDVIATEVAI